MSKINTGVTIPNASVLIPAIRKIMPQVLANQIVGVQPMSSTTGRSVFNMNISTEFGFEGHNKKYWPHQHTLNAWSKVSPAEQWCYANVKGRYWRNVGKYFAFKRECDYAVFLLKWS